MSRTFEKTNGKQFLEYASIAELLAVLQDRKDLLIERNRFLLKEVSKKYVFLQNFRISHSLK